MRAILLAFLVLLPAAAFAQKAAPDYASLDALFARRDQPGVITELKQKLEAALKQDPNDYGLLWRQARAIQWVADGETNGDKKAELGKQCWAIADKANAAKPNQIEANYFGAVCIGAYSQGVGILKALSQGLEGKFNERLDAALKINPKFQGCAPLIAKGRYYYELPWPKRDLDKSVETYEKAAKLCPESLRIYLYLSETELKKDGAVPALIPLQKVRDGKIDYDPPEGKRVKALIPTVQKEIQEEMQ
jgi:hypothetical protein